MTNDLTYMHHALALATRGLGRTMPNPSVGCVIVRDGQIVGRGWTADGGRPHAETIALKQAGEKAQGATMYVTLEPCAHEGKTPPCVDAIIEAGVSKVVIACEDPDPRVAGKGIKKLRFAKLEYDVGLCGAEAMFMNQGFFLRNIEKRPLVSVKLASSLDGRIATKTGQSQWITGEEARGFTHLVRAKYDAILTGIGTVIADNPLLSCRVPGLERISPIRMVWDRNLRLQTNTQLVQTAPKIPLWVITAQTPEHPQWGALKAHGARLISLPQLAQKDDVKPLLKLLAEEGITRLLVEAGPTLTSSFLRQRMYDRLYWFRAPSLIGGDGKPAVEPLNVAAITAMHPLHLLSRRPLGDDVIELYQQKHPEPKHAAVPA